MCTILLNFRIKTLYFRIKFLLWMSLSKKKRFLLWMCSSRLNFRIKTLHFKIKYNLITVTNKTTTHQKEKEKTDTSMLTAQSTTHITSYFKFTSNLKIDNCF